MLKALYLATFEAAKKWTYPLRNQGKVYDELGIMYGDRIENSTKNQNIKGKINTLREGALDIPDFECYSTVIGD